MEITDSRVEAGMLLENYDNNSVARALVPYVAKQSDITILII